jgi:hypothetical protein
VSMMKFREGELYDVDCQLRIADCRLPVPIAEVARLS